MGEKKNPPKGLGAVDAIEDLHKVVAAISEGVDRILQTGISEPALLHLIRNASPLVAGCRPEKKPTIGQIRAVVAGMAALEDYVFPVDEEERTQ